ncbi:hypothetical protein SPD48_05070 [Pseudogracilibacillus sp. SE30717A]|uniref:hypothetical protein n=1 Tax=Pseudogracilibacillus sp. SE30717A TaxID=3098293 RepID=UPI00300E6C2C
MNIGGLPFLPNATSLVERVVERLIDKSPQEIHEEGILPRGTIEKWKSDLEEKVIVGLVGIDKMYEECIQKSAIQFRRGVENRLARSKICSIIFEKRCWLCKWSNYLWGD